MISSNRFEVRRRGRVISSAARRAESGFRKPIGDRNRFLIWASEVQAHGDRASRLKSART